MLRRSMFLCGLIVLSVSILASPAVRATAKIDVSQDCDTSYLNCSTWDASSTVEKNNNYSVTVTRTAATCVATVCSDSGAACPGTDPDCTTFDLVEVAKHPRGTVDVQSLTAGWACSDDDDKIKCICNSGCGSSMTFGMTLRNGILEKAVGNVSAFGASIIADGESEPVPTIIDEFGVPTLNWWGMLALVLLILGATAWLFSRGRRPDAA